MKSRIRNLAFAITVGVGPITPLEELPRLQIDPQKVTASGISSGAMMAVQLLTAGSDKIHGAAAIAGGPFGCAQGTPETAQNICMKAPDRIDALELISQTKKLADEQKIPSLSNMKMKRLFVFAGTKDTVVGPTAGHKLVEWAEAFLQPQNIAVEFSVPAGHGFPTEDYGNACDKEALPWMNRCQYDGAQQILSHLSSKTLAKGKAVSANLKTVSVAPFIETGATMGSSATLYVPTSCQSATRSEPCALHIALHGCLQNPSIVRDAFVSKAGYNDWAEENHIVILYPTALNGAGNPYGCWDWWGYTGSNYMTKDGAQIKSILKMVDHLVE